MPGYESDGRFTRRDALKATVVAVAGGALGALASPDDAEAAKLSAAAVGFQVIYNLNGGVNPGGQPLWVQKGKILKVSSLLDPAREGYGFSGWYSDAKLARRATFVTGAKAKKARRIYAKWTPVEYGISYELDGGEQAAGQRTSYTVEDPTFALKHPSREGFEFRGWFSDAALTVPVGVVREGTVGDLKLYAKWGRVEADPSGLNRSAGIIELNPGVGALMRQAKRWMNVGGGTGESHAPILTLLHFSDIHGHSVNLARLQEFRDYYRGFIDDVIHTGDMVRGKFSDGISFWEENSDGSILTCIGNHDVSITGRGDSAIVPQSEAADAYISRWVGGWGDGVSWQEGTTYYYKDYFENGVRLIVLDCMLSGVDAEIQDLWFADALEGARGSGLSVVCAAHYPPENKVRLECTFTSMHRRQGSSCLDTRYQKTAQSFIASGGDFCCWLAGHAHCDYVEYNRDFPRQLFLVVTTAQVDNYWEDAERVVGERSQDAFNLVSFDTEAHVVKVVRVGKDRDHLLRHAGTLVVDYATAQVLYND